MPVLATPRRTRILRRHLASLHEPSALPAPAIVEPTSAEVEARLASALQSTGYAPLRKIQIRIDGGEVELRGELPSYFLKQLAQETIMQSPGAPRVRNLVEVVA
ncbi:BON domain-containing protein [Lignipirellula cremea]|uniref:BON domain protein n=1 Tax=Lignipirellula cremea TaxID=2528010 RepID=A0A518DSZ1_9BACT|nr:BON domain-containing protein [Lignipirellula cremea]QDU94965.1 BON domain protein [Lignipirellula cremea]